MKPTLMFKIKPNLPPLLEPLRSISGNLWFSWHSEAVELFQRLGGALWAELNHNPTALLNQLSQARLEELARDNGFVAEVERVAGQLAAYQDVQNCPFLGNEVPDFFKVAYFSAEYGLADCLPIYSGGLGMLSGDHLKSASDLNLPLIGVGLAYGQGYFNQYLNPDGWQQEGYKPNDFWNLPTELLKEDSGELVKISVDIQGRALTAQVWKVMVGRITLYLMDANLEENPPDFRAITYQLYGGDRQMRIRQEILLGIGGVRLLERLGIQPNVLHMNEGHSAFAALERIRQLRLKFGLSFDEACEAVKASTCFTTHTPVPAGNDYFDPELVRRHFAGYVEELGISMPVLLGFGRIHPRDQQELFCMTVLALRLSSFSNGVSKLHGEVSRHMWREVWPHFPLEDVPISHITNGVHIPSWISSDMAYLYDRYLGPAWMENSDYRGVWSSVRQIPDAELWRAHERRRTRSVAFLRKRLSEQVKRQGGSAEQLAQAAEALNPETLTLVFARRFATYKRAVLLLSDPDRLSAILNNPKRPVQVVFAGKAHPRDNEGKEYIRKVVALGKDPRFRQKLVFIEDYDINVARYLVQGADVWLNTPQRPLEACGTSGMKAAANGALNLSILDGWWDEAFEPGVGWAIGAGEEYQDAQEQNRIEANALYRILEDEVVPLFYNRGEDDLPRGWIEYMKKSLSHLCPEFNTHRMLADYTEEGYLPAAVRYNALVSDDFERARELGAWVRKIMENWGQVKVIEVTSNAPDTLYWGDEIEIRARVRLGELFPSDVACDLYFGPLDADGEFKKRETKSMEAAGQENGEYLFHGRLKSPWTGRMGLTVRLVPFAPQLSSKHSLGLAVWG
ncbi:alpha-glucan family phosphorylase [Dethiosulfatarculus sandiegensis]|uniref:Alpha-glucan phosphorylase n=1 Tax=Dethiosulfatarculus sandiegensis TaxID=1429043 RepID=A0A0D2IXG4_9BACT|nr:alpha-glucan family phosphorylase [Dethiosulfatarculus sandiegensis]KIX10739.1 alpha-glucan phosphorylase [Dethiosulfatarculus sandiegensis]